MFFKKIHEIFKNREANSFNLRGDDFWRKGETKMAEECFRSAIRVNKTYSLAYSNLGALLMSLHRYEEGFSLLKKAAVLNPNHSGILVNLGNALMMGGHIQQAVSTYQEAVRVNPTDPVAAASLLRPLMDICDWDGLEKHLCAIQNRIATGKEPDSSLFITPYNSLFLPLSRSEQLTIARHASRKIERAYGINRYKHASRARNHSKKIRLGYLSSDFHDHATAHLTLGMYGLHDRNSFEVYAYSIGYPDGSSYRKKIASDCDVFADVHEKSIPQIADQIAIDKIDILIDMKGYTGNARTGIMAMRPTPIQVNYLGYPGTMGADFIDYLIADPIIVPKAHEKDYSEEIVRLPDAYQPTDNKQFISNESLDRSAAGLPEEGIVFCSFNAPVKIDRRTFSCWMKILKAVPQSVLWLMKASPDATENLKRAADAAGVSPSRLIYASWLPKDRHLARLRMADLILDSFFCNAHTTATDALWAGIPIVTLTGETFASRVATSLLNAVGLSELAMHTEQDYVSLAVALGTNPHRLAHLKSALNNRTQKPLFNTVQYVSNLDNIYKEMFARHAR